MVGKPGKTGGDGGAYNASLKLAAETNIVNDMTNVIARSYDSLGRPSGEGVQGL